MDGIRSGRAWQGEGAASLGVVESLKWLALSVMLAEHWMRYVVGSFPPWLFNLGRIVFPLFVLALALGLRETTGDKLGSVTRRMLAWAVAAQVAMQLVAAPALRLNVLFTFGLGLAAARIVACQPPTLRTALALLAIGVASIWCEFGTIGVALVAAAVAVARAGDPSPIGALAVMVLLVALAVPNGNHFALAALPVALLVWALRLRIPRLRGAFYWAYTAQFPIFAVARQALA